MGLLLKDHLCNQPKALFCPSSDQPMDANAQLANVGTRQAQCSFYYRHAGNTNLFDNPNLGLAPPEHIKLDDLGNNRNGLPIRALAIDTQFLCSPSLATFGITPSTHHRQRAADILFSDGHTVSRLQPRRPLRRGPQQLRRNPRRLQQNPQGSRTGRHRTLSPTQGPGNVGQAINWAVGLAAVNIRRAGC